MRHPLSDRGPPSGTSEFWIPEAVNHYLTGVPMKRFLTALIVAIMLAGVVAVPAMAAPTDPEPCVPSVEVSSLTDPETNNVVRVTVTVTCNEDGSLDDISVTREVLQYWVPSKRDGRAGGHYETPDQRYAPPAPFRVCGPARAWNVCS